MSNEKIESLVAKDDHWIPLSDLMTGLMMVFLLIAILYMVKTESETQKITDVAILYDELKNQLYLDLKNEFERDLTLWGAELSKDLAIKFKEPDVLFDTGKDSLKPKFIEILNDFFPRYLGVLSLEKYRDSIEEVRIEGHTSSIWGSNTSEDQAYFLNMALSQARTRSVLQYVFSLTKSIHQKQWLKEHLTANGLSSSKPILFPTGREDSERSQRVEFRVKINSDERINEILRSVKNEAS